MPGTVVRGIVLRYADFRDYDRLLTILTPNEGVVQAVSRGCRRPKSALMACSELFVSGAFELYATGHSRAVQGCELQDTFYPLRTNPYRLTCASYLCALCERAAAPGQDHAALYALLLKALYYLSYDTECDALATTAAFLLSFIDWSGYRPRMKHCIRCHAPIEYRDRCVLDIEAGGFLCSNCNPEGPSAWLSRDDVIWMCDVLRNGFTARREPATERVFCALRSYVEARTDGPVKAGRMLP